jgi:hypothetical protein
MARQRQRPGHIPAGLAQRREPASESAISTRILTKDCGHGMQRAVTHASGLDRVFPSVRAGSVTLWCFIV